MNNRAPESDALSSKNAMAFAAWSQVYDRQPNPLLALEERFLKSLLSNINGKDILDVGSGTGRWIEYLSHQGTARSLCGVDSSIEMLSVARSKSSTDVTLFHAQLPLLPLSTNSIDLALASFVLSYIPDIDTCLKELARVLRDGADLFITDMHPETAFDLGWKRSFSSLEGSFHLDNNHHPIENLVQTAAQYGLRLVASYQPSFGEPERSIFVSNDKESSYHNANGRPAIYLLHFKCDSVATAEPDVTLGAGYCVLSSEAITEADLELQDGRVTRINSIHTHRVLPNAVDLSGYTLFPGLINAHDHLEFALFPRLGTPPYNNATEWALDIQLRCNDTIAIHKKVPKAVRLWWGALRNLLCGVTSVCHHNPSHPVFNESGFPIKVVTEFGWEHSITFANDLSARYSQSHPSQPFILHACEGVDTAARDEFQQLQNLNLLDDRTVLVHGLAMRPKEVAALNLHGAALISCPSSNKFLFRVSPSVEHLCSIRRLAIGSDSPLTAAGDLLDEMRFCHNELHLSPKRLFDCVTQEPARVLRLKQGEARIGPNSSADVFAVRSPLTPITPAQHLVSLSWHDIELVIVGGRIRLASADILQRLPSQLRNHLSCLFVDGVPRWVDAPVNTLFHSAAEILGATNVSLSGRVVSVMEI